MASLRPSIVLVIGTLAWAAAAGCSETATRADGATYIGTVTETRGDKEVAVLLIGRIWVLLDAVANQRLNDVSLLPETIDSMASEATFGERMEQRQVTALPPRPSTPPTEASTTCDVSGCAFVDYLQQTLYADFVDGAVRLTSAGASRQLKIEQLIRGGPTSAPFQNVLGGTIDVTGTAMRGQLTSWRTSAGTRGDITTLAIDGVESVDTGSGLLGTNPWSGTMTIEWMAANDEGLYTGQRATISFP